MTQHFISLDAVSIPENRQRRQFDPAALNDLADSIERLGILQPPVLRLVGEVYTLVAGERRLRAMRDLHELGRTFRCYGREVPLNTIPYTPIGELSEVDAMEAELEENIRREDLTWQERATATAGLAKLRADQARIKGDAPPTVAKIAEEIHGSSVGDYQEKTRKDIILARHLDDPVVAKAKTAKEAFTLLKKQEEVRKNTQLAATIGKTFSASQHVCLNRDSLTWLDGCESGLFDVILTDPPYGMGADEFGDSGTAGSAGAHFYPDSADVLQKILAALPEQLFRITKPEAHAYIFCDIDWFPTWKDRMADAGWKVFRTPLIWYKPSGFRAPWPDQGPQRKYETILYAVKGDRKTTRMAPDVLACAADTQLGHPAQKPVALYEDLLRRSARAGDSVLDPFCGSGPIFAAASNLKLTATGIELNPAAFAIAVQRIQTLTTAETSEPELPL